MIKLHATGAIAMPIEIRLHLLASSKDVIHSAYFPEFRAQMNTVPGMTTRFKFTPTITTKEIRLKRKDTKFEYTLMCNKNCGVGHNTMKMVVRVLEKEEFDRQIKNMMVFQKR